MGAAQKPQQPRKAGGRTRRKVVIIGLVVLLLAAAWLGYRYWMQLGILGDESVNIVFIGVDAPMEEAVLERDSSGGYTLALGQQGQKADAVFVGTIHPATRKFHLLGLPPELIVTLPDGSEGELRAVFAAGGVPAVEKVAEDLLQIPIHYYVLVDYGGFTELVDAIGGVEVDVKTPIRYYDDGELIFELKEGIQRLLGPEALRYVRYRRGSETDLNRLERQRDFLIQLADEMLQAASIAQLPTLARYCGGTWKVSMSQCCRWRWWRVNVCRTHRE
jgi:LCP family protein required for cell wall assembly